MAANSCFIVVPPIDKSKKFTSALFTMNNPLSNDEPRRWMALEPNIKGIVWQLEKGALAGVQHLQGYVKFHAQTRITKVIKFSPGVHWQPKTFGDDADMIAYCQKEETRLSGPWTEGDITVSVQGKRSDIATTLDAIKKGVRPRDLLIDDSVSSTYVKHMTNFDKAAMYLGVNQRKEQTVALILWGPPATGKTFAAEQFCREHKLTFMVCPLTRNKDGNPWFDGYSGQDAVIVNEMDGGWCKPTFYLNLIDKCQVKVEIKGGSVDFTSKLVIFTSNKDPLTWWLPTTMSHHPGLERRLKNSDSCVVKFFPEELALEVRVKSATAPPPPTLLLAQSFKVGDSPTLAQFQQAQRVMTEDGQDLLDHLGRRIYTASTGASASTYAPHHGTAHDHAMAALSTTIAARAAQTPSGMTPEEWVQRKRDAEAAQAAAGISPESWMQRQQQIRKRQHVQYDVDEDDDTEDVREVVTKKFKKVTK